MDSSAEEMLRERCGCAPMIRAVQFCSQVRVRTASSPHNSGIAIRLFADASQSLQARLESVKLE